MPLRYGETPGERDAFFKPRLYKRVEISQVEVYERVGKFVIYSNYFKGLLTEILYFRKDAPYDHMAVSFHLQGTT